MLLPDAEVYFQMAQWRHSNWTRHETSETTPSCSLLTLRWGRRTPSSPCPYLLCWCRSRLSANRLRYSHRYCWLSSHRFDLLVWGSIWDGTCNSFYHSLHSTGSLSTIAGNRLVRISLRFYSGTIDYLSTNILSYSSIQSRRRGERWVIRLIHRCWKILHLIWMHRNAALHESEAHHNNRGATHLPSVIASEHFRDLDSLHRVYAPYFRISLADSLNRQISYQKQWFLF